MLSDLDLIRDQEPGYRICVPGYPCERRRAGVIKTPMHDSSTHEFLASLHPVGRLGEIEDVMGALRYLEGAQFVTGETVHVDGGQAAGS